MTKKSNKIKIETKEEPKEGDTKVIFHNTYIGSHGCFIADKVYTISHEIYILLKNDCKEI